LLAFQADQSLVRRLHSQLPEDESRRELDTLAKVRREHVAWAELGRVGLASVAVPVFGSHDIQASLAILGTTAMLSPDDSSAAPVKLLREAAEQLSDLVAK
jgi:DNA-binding IclR family transcriptional regulator